jgi:hypothetical protein
MRPHQARAVADVLDFINECRLPRPASVAAGRLILPARTGKTAPNAIATHHAQVYLARVESITEPFTRGNTCAYQPYLALCRRVLS